MNKFTEICRRHRTCVTVLLFLVCWITAFLVRTWHYNQAVERMGAQIQDITPENRPHHSTFRKFFPLYHENFQPFTIESAVMYSYAKDIALGKGVPAHDKTLCGMEDIPPYAQMNMGLEWFLGWGWRLKQFIVPDLPPTEIEKQYQDYPRMAQFMSDQLRLWASLTSALVFLWLTVLHCPRLLALGGGLLHAVSLAAVARSTGQDFVRGEFCIPLIVSAIVLAHSIYTRPKVWKYILLGAVTFLAFVTWDLCQMLFGTWAVFEIFRFSIGRRITVHRALAWAVIAAAVLLNAFFVPFNRTYGLIRSPLVWAALPTLGICYFAALKTPWFRRRDWRRPLLAVVLFGVLYGFWAWQINTPEYDSNYSHFRETMAAKLKFRNVKPHDPARLSYDARIMWTPSMHSATWEIATSFFPSFYFGRAMSFRPFRFFFGDLPVTLGFFAFLLLAATLFRVPRLAVTRGLSVSLMPILYTIGFTVGFIYIVRYHEFLILFLAVALPLVVRDYLKAFRYAPERVIPEEAYTHIYEMPRLMKTVRILIYLICVLLLAWETGASLQARRRFTGDVQLQDTARLIAWFRTERPALEGKGVAVNFTVGPMLKAYAGTALVMNPQFGMKRLRDQTQEFIEAMFAKDESDLLDYCEKYHVDYVIYNNGLLFNIGTYSVRYIAGAKEVEARSPANLMYYRPEMMRWFYQIEPPADRKAVSRTFRVFKVIRPEAKEKAVNTVIQGLQAKTREEAERCAVEAVSLDPSSPAARNFYRDIFGKRPGITLGGVADISAGTAVK